MSGNTMLRLEQLVALEGEVKISADDDGGIVIETHSGYYGAETLKDAIRLAYDRARRWLYDETGLHMCNWYLRCYD